ncbi:MAG: hypothetical protein SPI71_03485 [Acidaminococcaceae bacterium]|nr:hypothetical protein [Acidaminococcaceae bacterium]
MSARVYASSMTADSGYCFQRISDGFILSAAVVYATAITAFSVASSYGKMLRECFAR